MKPCTWYRGGFGSERTYCTLPKGHAGECDFSHVCGPLCPEHGDPRDTSIKDPLMLGYVATPEELQKFSR